MVIKLLCPIYKFFILFFVISFNLYAQEYLGSPLPKAGEYSLDAEKFGKPIYTPLKKIERQVLSYPYKPEETTIPESPLGGDFYTYVLPQEIFGRIELLELEIIESIEKIERIRAEELIKEIEEALPIVMKEVQKRKEEHEQGFILRIKVKEKEKEAKPEVTAKLEEKKIVKEESPSEEEIDVLINFIFGQGKVVIKIPPLKDPQEKERLIKELEKIAHILVRQEQLLSIEVIGE